MIVWGSYNRDRCEETGCFDCPTCGESRQFQFFRTHEYFHVWFIPLFRKGVVAEYVTCSHCNSQHSIGVLRSQAETVDSPATASSHAGASVMEYFGNVVTLTPETVAEINRLRETGGFGEDVAVRILPEDEILRKCRIGFDIPEADGSDWIGESGGLMILVDRRDAPLIHGATIQYQDGGFKWYTAHSPPIE